MTLNLGSCVPLQSGTTAAAAIRSCCFRAMPRFSDRPRWRENAKKALDGVLLSHFWCAGPIQAPRVSSPRGAAYRSPRSSCQAGAQLQPLARADARTCKIATLFIRWTSTGYRSTSLFSFFHYDTSSGPLTARVRTPPGLAFIFALAPVGAPIVGASTRPMPYHGLLC